MECLTNNEGLVQWIIYYGPIALFCLLAVGILALPVPEETLMVLTGIVMQSETIPIIETTLAAYGGSMCGITMSYFVGRTAGIFFVHKYGKWVGLNDKILDKVHQWFDKWGKWTLVVGYFIPGVRHFTGLIAGTSKLEFGTFALFAYVGAVLWVSTFLSIGYFFGNYCMSFLKALEMPGEEVVIGISLTAAALAAFYFWYKRRNNHKEKS